MIALSVVKIFAKTLSIATLMLEVLPKKTFLGYKWEAVDP